MSDENTSVKGKNWNDAGMENFGSDFLQARKDFARALAEDPFNSKYYHNHGRKNLSLDHFEEALADFAMVMRLAPEDDESCHYQGVAYLYLGLYDLAIDCFRRSIALMQKKGVELIPPTVDWAWMACMRKGDRQQAQALLDAYIYPEIPCGKDDMNYKRRTLMYKGSMTPEEFEASINLEDDLDAITDYYGLANYYHYVAADDAKYRAAIERTLSFPTMHNAFAYKLAAMDLAEIEGKNELPPIAGSDEAAALEALVKEHPTDHESWFKLGQTYFETDFQRARECFSMALAQDPFNAEYRFNRGRKALSADDFEDALADFAYSVRLDPEDGFKWHYLANAYFFLGAYDEAVKYYKLASVWHDMNGVELVPPAIDWIWMSYMHAGRRDEATQYLMANTSPDMPVQDSDLSYKKRILLYAGYTDIDRYLREVVNYGDALDAITELYGAVNYYKYIAPDPEKAAECNRKVLAYSEYHHSFAYKLALQDAAAGLK